jgi:hypothetical protein
MAEPKVAGTSSWDKYSKGYYPDQLSTEQREVRGLASAGL